MMYQKMGKERNNKKEREDIDQSRKNRAKNKRLEQEIKLENKVSRQSMAAKLVGKVGIHKKIIQQTELARKVGSKVRGKVSGKTKLISTMKKRIFAISARNGATENRSSEVCQWAERPKTKVVNHEVYHEAKKLKFPTQKSKC